MTNPYLAAAEEITGQDLRNAYQGSPGATAKNPSRVAQEQVRKVYTPKPGLKQKSGLNPLPKNALPQGASFSPKQLGNFGALSGFSKIRKMVFLAALGAGFAASKLFLNKYEVLLLAEHPEYKGLKNLIPKAEKVLLPATGLFAFPVALALFSDQEWPMLAWLCWLGAVAYMLKETGPGVIGIIRETKGAASDYKEKKLATARKRARRKR
jgi:hypothetical protein